MDMDGLKDGWEDGRMEEWKVRRMDDRWDEWMDGNKLKSWKVRNPNPF